MPYAIRKRSCEDCGREMEGRLPPVKAVRCIHCAVEVVLRTATEMAYKSGPAYDRWLESRGPKGRPPITR